MCVEGVYAGEWGKEERELNLVNEHDGDTSFYLYSFSLIPLLFMIFLPLFVQSPRRNERKNSSKRHLHSRNSTIHWLASWKRCSSMAPMVIFKWHTIEEDLSPTIWYINNQRTIRRLIYDWHGPYLPRSPKRSPTFMIMESFIVISIRKHQHHHRFYHCHYRFGSLSRLIGNMVEPIQSCLAGWLVRLDHTSMTR